MNKETVLLAMSGGVDSSAAAVVLQQMGYRVIGATMQLFGKNEESVRDARRVCDNLKIEHHVLDYTQEFENTVIADFLKQYQEAKTPNPCIVCNKFLKFGKLLEFAKTLGANYIATGHYAKIEKENGKYLLRKSKADKKDQTYVLYQMTQEILAHTLFPLGDYESKEEIRKIAKETGLDVANKPDSQEICFIPDHDYVKFIEDKIGKFQEGNVIDEEGNVLGKHQGIIHYTIGQRKGLGISNKTPLFVLRIDKGRNEVIVGKENSLFSKNLVAEKMNYISGDIPSTSFTCKAKIRYAAQAVPCEVFPIENNRARIVFTEPQRAITPGQAVVLYQDDFILGGGTIC